LANTKNVLLDCRLVNTELEAAVD